MIPAIKEINFPEYATLSQATVNIADMGEKTITTQIKIDGSVVPDFSFDWIVEYEGERYIHSAREPQASKENTSMRTTIDLTFKHWAVVELQRYYFVEMASTEAGTVIPDKYIASLGLDLPGFINALNNVLDYWYGSSIKAVLNPAWYSSSERTYVDINYSHVWDVLQKVYDYYGVRWTIEQNGDGKCLIKFGYAANEVSHIFQYGYEGGLLKVERQVQNTDIRNVLIGYGGDRNLPYLYFKDYAKYGNSANSDNGAFMPDPDAIPELKDIPFTKLRSAEFRSYVQGWAARHYGGTVSRSQAYVPWAWEKGYTDGTFAPVDYVKDDDSIRKYGEHWGGLNDNDDIYPSIQGSGVNDIVAVDKILSDDVKAKDSEADSVTANVNGTTLVYGNLAAYAERELTKTNIATFTVPDGMTGVLLPTGEPQPAAYRSNAIRVENDRIHDAVTVDWSYSVRNSSGSTVNPSNIKPGTYSVDVTVKVTNALSSTIYNVTAVVAGFSLVTSTASNSDTKGATFDVWLKNIWETSKNPDETDKEYAERVWLPILGTADERAQLIFTTGLLSVSSDYEFTIVGIPVYDTSKSYYGVQSHWRMTLGRSQAEYKATGRLVPNTQINAVPGDNFIFTGIELPHQYILWAEQRLHDWKQDNLLETASIQPTWVVSVDKVRANNMEPGEFVKLSEQLKVGSLIRIADDRLTNGVPVELHVQSATYTWNEPSEGSPYIYPDMEVVLSDKVVVATNPVSQLQGEISALQSFVGGLSNIQQIVKAVGDRLYLRKDGIADLSNSPTRFANVVTGSLFRQGSIGGRDWGFYRDNNGNAVLETDRLIVRQDLSVNSILINQASYVGGIQINSAASIECTEVYDTEEGYKCYFDVKQGSVANLFKVDDVAFCQRWNADTKTQKYYKRRVVAIGEDYIVLTKGYDPEEEDGDTGVYGTGIPEAKDNIIQYGNYTDKNRQDVIIRDVIGGGYERMLTGLDSVNSSGNEYYFAGRQSSTGPRWFVGDKEGNEYAEYVNGELTISGRLTVKSQIQDSDGSYIAINEYLRSVGHRIFHEQPVPPYDVDDLWVNATYPESVEEGDEYLYNNAILRCKTAKSAYVSNPDEEGEDVQPEPEVFSIDDWEPASGYTDDTEVKKLSYLKSALGESTVIDGGLVLTSLIQLGMTVGDTYQVYSGINGIMDESAKGKGIAAWYGGPMVDREVDTDAERYAESLFRFDGSGYLAGGSITWDERGNGHVGRDVNGNPVLSWDEKGVSISDTIRIGTGDETLTTVLNFIAKMDMMFELDTKSIPGKTLIKAKYDGLYTEGFLSALGLNPDSEEGGGASYLSDLYDVNKDSVLGAKRNDVLTWDGTKWVAQAASGGTVKSIRIGSSSPYTPDSSGVISLPAYPDLSGYYTRSEADSAIKAAVDSGLSGYYTKSETDSAIASALTGYYTKGQVDSAINSALTSVMKFQGVTTTDISDGSTTGTVIIDGASYTAKKGDVVLYGSKEFVWTGSAWEELGDEASWALKTVTITGTGYLTGGGSLAANRTIDIADTYKTHIQHGETAYGYFSDGVLGVSHLPSLYVGTTKIQSVSAAQALTGITDITMSGKLKIGDATIEWDKDNSALKIDAGVYSEKFMSALGLNGSSGSGGGSDVSYDRLDEWPANSIAGKEEWVLSAKLGWDLHTRLNTVSGNITSLTQRIASLEGTVTDGTVKSVGLSMPTGFSVSGSPVTKSGTLSVVFASGYSLPTTAKQAEWDAKQGTIGDLDTIRNNAALGAVAHGWGNHASAGYAKSSDLSNYVKRSGDTMTGALKLSDTYAYAIGSNTADNVPCYRFERKDVFGFGIGYNTSNQIVIGGYASGAISPYMTLDYSGATVRTSLTVSSSSGAATYVNMGRAGHNYIRATEAGGDLSFMTDGASASAAANATLQLIGKNGRPGTTNTGTWGESSYRWANVYSVLGNFSDAVTASGGIVLPAPASSWSAMATNDKVIRASSSNSASSTHPFIRVTGMNGDVIVFGGYQNRIGFFGWTSDLIESGANSYSYQTYWDAPTGKLFHSKDLQVSGAVTLSSNLSVSGAATFNSTLKIGGATLSWDGTALKIDKGLYSEEFISALGMNPDSGAAGASYLEDLLDVDVKTKQPGQVLTYRNGKWVAESPQSGMDTAQLASYLTSGGYLKSVSTSGNGNVVTSVTQSGQSVVVTKGITALTSADLAGYATQSWVNGIGFITSAALNGYATQDWVTGKGYITQSALTWSNITGKPTNLAYTDSNVASASKLADNSAYTAWGQTFFNNGVPVSVSGSLTSVVDITMSGSLKIGGATLTWDYENNALKINTGLYSEKWMSALGINPDAGVAGASYLSDLIDVNIGTPLSGQVLTYRAGKWVAETPQAGLDTTQLAAYLASNGYATQSWVTGQLGSYLTSAAADSTYVSALGVSGNYLTWTKAGKVNNLTVPYATNADTVDGYHASDFVSRTHYSSNKTGSGYYKITINSTTAWMLYFRIRLYQSYRYYDIDISGYNYGENHWYQPKARLVSSSSDSIAVTFGYDSDWNLWVALPGANYTGLDIIDVTNGNVQVSLKGLFTVTNVDSLTGTTQTTVTAYRSATINDNVASSDALSTQRKLWGHSFDGTADVSGNMTGVGNITMNGYIHGAYLYNTTIPSDAGNLGGAVGIGISYNAYGTFIWGESNGSGHIQVGRKDGSIVTYSLILQQFGGNVGIGTTSPSYKLHVAGTLYASGATTLASTLSVAGATTVGSLKIGGATLSWVPASGGNQGYLKVDSGFASDSFVSALGMNPDSGSGSGGGEVLTFTTTGAGNAVTSVTKSGTTVTVTKGTTFLTSHQRLYSLIFTSGKFGGSTSYDPTSSGNEAIYIPTNTSHLTNDSGFFNASTRLDSFNEYLSNRSDWVLSAGLGYNLHTRVTALENAGGSAADVNITFRESNEGNVITALSAKGSQITITRGTAILSKIYPLQFEGGKFGGKGGYDPTSDNNETINIPTHTSHLTNDSSFVTSSSLTNGSVTKVGTSDVGSVTLPIYLKAGVPTACTASSVFSALSVSGTTLSITVAGQTRTATLPSGGGSVDLSGYVKRSGDTMTGTLTVPTVALGYCSITTGTNGGLNLKDNDGHGIVFQDTFFGPGTSSGNGVLDLGRTSYRWANVYSVLGNFSSTVSAKGFNDTSDLRLKSWERDIFISVEAISHAPSVAFRWTDGSGFGAGTYAQYWQGIVPEVVKSGADGYLSLQYGNLALVSVISVARKVSEHDRRIAALERENAELRKEVELLKAA